METQTKKYRLMFIPDDEYKVFDKATEGMKAKMDYAPLTEKGIPNFLLKDDSAVFIPESHQGILRVKAKKGEQL